MLHFYISWIFFTQSLETANKCKVQSLKYSILFISLDMEMSWILISRKQHRDRPSNSIYLWISISRCLPESSLAEERCGEGLIQDSSKFADSRGRRGMTSGQWGASPMTNPVRFPGVSPTLGDCWNSRKQGGWASQRFYHRPRHPPSLGYVPNDLRIPVRRGGARRWIFLFTIIPGCFATRRFNNVMPLLLGCLKLAYSREKF